MKDLAFRSLALLLITGVAGSAHAADAFSNVDPSFTPGSGYAVGGGFQSVIGYRFTSGLTGSLTGFKLAINNVQSAQGVQYPFEVSIYTNSASDTLGTLLGTFSGLSTGNYPATPTLATVVASGPDLVANSQYWLVASSTSQVTWNTPFNGASNLPGYYSTNGNPGYGTEYPGGFSVQVTPVPEPTTFVALGMGGLAFVRRRKRS